MFKVKLLLYVQVFSSTNLFAVKDSISEKSDKDSAERVAGAKRKLISESGREDRDK